MAFSAFTEKIISQLELEPRVVVETNSNDLVTEIRNNRRKPRLIVTCLKKEFAIQQMRGFRPKIENESFGYMDKENSDCCIKKLTPESSSENTDVIFTTHNYLTNIFQKSFNEFQMKGKYKNGDLSSFEFDICDIIIVYDYNSGRVSSTSLVSYWNYMYSLGILLPSLLLVRSTGYDSEPALTYTKGVYFPTINELNAYELKNPDNMKTVTVKSSIERFSSNLFLVQFSKFETLMKTFDEKSKFIILVIVNSKADCKNFKKRIIEKKDSFNISDTTVLSIYANSPDLPIYTKLCMLKSNMVSENNTIVIATRWIQNNMLLNNITHYYDYSLTIGLDEKYIALPNNDYLWMVNNIMYRSPTVKIFMHRFENINLPSQEAALDSTALLQLDIHDELLSSRIESQVLKIIIKGVHPFELFPQKYHQHLQHALRNLVGFVQKNDSGIIYNQEAVKYNIMSVNRQTYNIISTWVKKSYSAYEIYLFSAVVYEYEDFFTFNENTTDLVLSEFQGLFDTLDTSIIEGGTLQAVMMTVHNIMLIYSSYTASKMTDLDKYCDEKNINYESLVKILDRFNRFCNSDLNIMVNIVSINYSLFFNKLYKLLHKNFKYKPFYISKESNEVINSLHYMDDEGNSFKLDILNKHIGGQTVCPEEILIIRSVDLIVDKYIKLYVPYTE